MRLTGLLVGLLAIQACNRTPSPHVDAANPPARFAGMYHLDQDDATNLELRADGTFRWSLEACDLHAGDCGTWAAVGGGLELRPGNARSFSWVVGSSFANETLLLEIEPESTSDSLIISGRAGRNDVRQVWKRGRVCSVCGDQQPTGTRACTDPLAWTCP
jgi:hypothetical protein